VKGLFVLAHAVIRHSLYVEMSKLSSTDAFYALLDQQQARLLRRIPPKGVVQALADQLFEFLFPIRCPDPKPASVQVVGLKYSLEQLLRVVWPDGNGSVHRIGTDFFEQLPDVHTRLLEDAEAFYKFDPAAVSVDEVVATYPGFQAIAYYRLAHELFLLEVPMLPRLFTEYAHSMTGIDIHPGATIGRSFFIDHGTGVVIGATAVIGDNVKIYQGVTLGALQVDKSLANTKRHPTIEDNCVIYANSTILGGDTVVGHSSVIGGNTWLTQSVQPYSVVLHQPQIKVRTRPFDEPINFVI
jgi:serine O-acetyltransferase